MIIGIAGFGWWGRHISNRLKGHPSLRIAAVAEPVAALHPEIEGMGLRVVDAYEELLADPSIDAVMLTTPNMFHEEQVVAGAAAGKHVFCEKPLGITETSARRSVEACRAAGVVLGIGQP